jgi:hypothetical protein
MQSLMASNALAGARGAYAAPNSRAKLNRRVAMSTRRPAAGAVTVRAGKTPDGPKVAIAGISGAVGTEFMRVRARPRHTRRSTLRAPSHDRTQSRISIEGATTSLFAFSSPFFVRPAATDRLRPMPADA